MLHEQHYYYKHQLQHRLHHIPSYDPQSLCSPCHLFPQAVHHRLLSVVVVLVEAITSNYFGADNDPRLLETFGNLELLIYIAPRYNFHYLGFILHHRPKRSRFQQEPNPSRVCHMGGRMLVLTCMKLATYSIFPLAPNQKWQCPWRLGGHSIRSRLHSIALSYFN